MIGDMPEPCGFRYRETLLRGKPQHSRTDAFRARHPSMDVGKRAKIFAPFDALKGFNEAVAAKDVLYEDKRELNEEDLAELNRRLRILRGLTSNSRMAGENCVKVTVTYYVPCSDRDSESYGRRGQYEQMTGICRKVDAEVTKSILIDDRRIPFAQILRIEAASDLLLFSDSSGSAQREEEDGSA